MPFFKGATMYEFQLGQLVIQVLRPSYWRRHCQGKFRIWKEW